MKKSALLVLGMHRSGSSALTRVLSLLGASLPETLMPPDPNNEAGYWESAPINQCLEIVLRAAHTSWQDWTMFDPAWHRSERAALSMEKLRDAVRSEFLDARLPVIKDP